MLAEFVLSVFVMKNVNADQQETRSKNQPIGDKDKNYCGIFNFECKFEWLSVFSMKHPKIINPCNNLKGHFNSYRSER
jgi:hypothetical protein